VKVLEDLFSTFPAIEFLFASSAEHGIELARARRPDVIIMDVHLPGMTGIDALRVLRERPETNGTPVIALTAAATDRDRREAAEAGFYRYLTKPVRVEDLLIALEDLFEADRE
jgi:CheY-like chemotaxis protein